MSDGKARSRHGSATGSAMSSFDGDDICDIQLHPVCLTHDQCAEYALPRTPIKESDLREARFEERYGSGATELDALEALYPGILVREIERFYDPGVAAAWRRAWWLAQVRLGRISAEVLSRHAEKDADLEERLAALRETADGLALDIEERNVVIKSELLEASRGAAFGWPMPRDADEWPDPLFDSSRGYLEQIASYKSFQGKPTRRRKRRRQ